MEKRGQEGRGKREGREGDRLHSVLAKRTNVTCTRIPYNRFSISRERARTTNLEQLCKSIINSRKSDDCKKKASHRRKTLNNNKQPRPSKSVVLYGFLKSKS